MDLHATALVAEMATSYTIADRITTTVCPWDL